MVYNPQHGKNCSVTIGGTAYTMDEWKFNPKNNLAKVTNFTSGGYDLFISGITSGEVTVSAPAYDEGNSNFVVGNTYTLSLATAAFTVSVPGILKDINMDAKVDDAVKVQYSFNVTGAFTAATS